MKSSLIPCMTKKGWYVVLRAGLWFVKAGGTPEVRGRRVRVGGAQGTAASGPHPGLGHHVAS